MAGLDLQYLNTLIKINFYQNNNIITSNYLKKDELIFDNKNDENIIPKINFSLHTSRLNDLPEGNYKLKIFFENKDLFTNLYIKEISPSKTELRIGLSTESNPTWTLWAYNPDILWKSLNRFITINNDKFRIINVVPDYLKVNEDLINLQKLINISDDEKEIETLTNKKNNLAGKTTFILKVETPINFDLVFPFENKSTYLNIEEYENIEYDDVYVYASSISIPDINNLSNDFSMKDENYYNTEGKSYTDLVSNYSSSLFSFISSSLQSGTKKINVDYESITDFNYFGKFENKLKNSFDKIKQIEIYNNLISTYTSGSKPEASSSLQYYEKEKNNIINNFSLYENYVYNQTGSYAWPKHSSLINYSYSSSIITNWYSSSIEIANNFDNENKNLLIRNIPENVLNNDENKNITNLLYIWGDFFDEIKCYIDQIPYFWNINYDNINSISDDYLEHLGNILQQNMYEGYDKEDLGKFALGLGLETGSIKLQDATKEKWKRLLDNLPYLNKIKGTKRSIETLLNIYGIPNSILRLKEYGGGNKETGSAYIEDNKNTYVLNVNNNNLLRLPTSSFNQIDNNDFTYELWFNTPNFTNMNLFGNNGFTVNLVTSSIDSGSLRLDTADENIHISWSNVWYNDWNYVYLQRSGSILKLGAKQYKDDQLFINISGSTTIVDTDNFNPNVSSGYHVYFNSSSNFSGSMQEIRLWKTALNNNELNHHAFDFDSIAMESYSAVDNYLVGHWKLNDNTDLSTTQYVNDYNRTVNKYDMDAFNFTHNQFKNETIYDNILQLTNFNINLYSDNKINIGYNHSSSQFKNSNRVDLMFSPTDYINKDILNEFSMLDFNDVIGKPSDMYESNYSSLDTWRKYYFSKFNSNYNFFAFIKFIRNFDQSIYNLVEDLLPERCILKKGLVIRSNILERSKYQWIEPSVELPFWSSSLNINDVYTFEESINEELNDRIWSTGSLTSEYISYTANCIVDYTSSYGEIIDIYLPNDKNIIPEQLDYLTYRGSINDLENDYNDAPVQVSESAGTFLIVE